MNSHPNTFFLFDPESHYTNSRAIYKAIKALLEKKYYGNMSKTQKVKLDEKFGPDIDVAKSEDGEKITKIDLKNQAKKQEKKLKGTLFQRC